MTRTPVLSSTPVLSNTQCAICWEETRPNEDRCDYPCKRCGHVCCHFECLHEFTKMAGMVECPKCTQVAYSGTGELEQENFHLDPVGMDSRIMMIPFGRYSESLFGYLCVMPQTFREGAYAREHILPHIDIGNDVYTSERALLRAADLSYWDNYNAVLGLYDTRRNGNNPVSNVQNNSGSRVIHTLACKDEVENIRRLHEEYSCSLLVSDHKGNTPLHYACAFNSGYGPVNSVDYIINHGGYTEETNNAGMTPLDIARESHVESLRTEIVDEYNEQWGHTEFARRFGDSNPFGIIISMLVNHGQQQYS